MDWGTFAIYSLLFLLAYYAIYYLIFYKGLLLKVDTKTEVESEQKTVVQQPVIKTLNLKNAVAAKAVAVVEEQQNVAPVLETENNEYEALEYADKVAAEEKADMEDLKEELQGEINVVPNALQQEEKASKVIEVADDMPALVFPRKIEPKAKSEDLQIGDEVNNITS